jgi:hypothetical protein
LAVTRIVNQIKAILARFGIRTFRPTLRKAAEKLDGLRSAEGTPLLETRARSCGAIEIAAIGREGALGTRFGATSTFFC